MTSTQNRGYQYFLQGPQLPSQLQRVALPISQYQIKLLVTTWAALPENNEASVELATANGETFNSCSARLSSQSRYRSLDQ